MRAQEFIIVHRCGRYVIERVPIKLGRDDTVSGRVREWMEHAHLTTGDTIKLEEKPRRKRP